MIMLALLCAAASVAATVWSRDAFGLSILALKGQTQKHLIPRGDKTLSVSLFIKGHGYAALGLYLAAAAGFALGRGL